MQMQLVPAEHQHGPMKRGVSSKPTLNSANKKYLQIAADKMGTFRQQRPSKQSDLKNTEESTFYMTHVQAGSPKKGSKSRLKSLRSIQPPRHEVIDSSMAPSKLASVLAKKEELSLKDLVILKSSKFSNTQIQPEAIQHKQEHFFPDRKPVGARLRINLDGQTSKFALGRNES